MLIADRDAFQTAVLNLWHVASWMKDSETGLLVKSPSNDVERYRAALRGALSLLFNAPIQIGDEKIVTLANLNAAHEAAKNVRPNPAE